MIDFLPMTHATIHQKFSLSSKIFGAIILISGTSIGGGMLALPVVTQPVGFLPSLFLCIVTWLFMTYTAYLILECNLAIDHGNNLISMSRNTLKLPGVIITWGCYLLLLYSLMATYISGISSLVGRTLQNCLGISPHAASVHLAVITLLPIIYKVRIIDQVNRLFSIIGILCFGFLIFSLASHVDNSYLTRYSLNQLSYSLPVLVTSFGFHIVIPILVRYLDRDVAALRYCIFIGSLIPLFIYGIWQLSVMGSIPPEGGYGMSEIIRSPDQLNSLIEAITFVTKNMYIEIAFSLLSAFVILTSFIGVGISLWDFLSDGLSHTPRWTNNAISLTVATIGPPLCLVLWFPKAFSELLSYAGVFVSILLGLLPIAMCWKGRKRSTWGKEYLTPGGKGALILSALFFFYVALVELFF